MATISDWEQPECVYPRHLSTSACSLPTEVLVKIFRYAFDLHAVHWCAEDFEDNQEDFVIGGPPIKEHARVLPAIKDQHMSYLSLFPFCISYVCSEWNKICLGFPEFWTRIFIDVGSQAFSILQLRNELEASQNQKIRVYISRRDGFTGEDPLEHRRMAAFLNVLSLHASRCKTVHIKTMHRSSLFPFFTHVLKDASSLSEIRAYSQPESQESILFQNNQIHFCAPKVKTIQLDVALFQQSLPHQSFTLCPHDSLTTLTVLDLASSISDRVIELPLADTFQLINHMLGLCHLSLDGVCFLLPEPSYSTDVPILHRPTTHLTLKNLQSEDTALILHSYLVDGQQAEYLDIIGCSISDVDPKRFPNTLRLTLQDIDEDLDPILQQSDPYTLIIINCPLFTLRTIRKMTPRSRDSQWYCQRLVHLSIMNKYESNQISIDSVMDLVASRIRAHEVNSYGQDDDWFARHAKIRSLWLSGFGYIDREDLSWLQEHVRDVYY